MPLLIALHDGDGGASETLEEAVWQLSESHWSFGTGLMVVTEVSPAYLAQHLSEALDRAGLRASLLVTPLGPDACLEGLPEEGRAWLQAAIPVSS